MIDRVVATAAEAFAFATTYRSTHDAKRVQADADYVRYGIRIAERS